MDKLASFSKNELARRLNITPQAVSRWFRLGRVPVLRVPEIEAVFGISRHDLRPDFFGPKPSDAQSPPQPSSSYSPRERPPMTDRPQYAQPTNGPTGTGLTTFLHYCPYCCHAINGHQTADGGSLAHCVCGWSQFVSGKALNRPRAFTPNVGIK